MYKPVSMSIKNIVVLHNVPLGSYNIFFFLSALD